MSWRIQRMGALYGIDDRGVRADRIQKWTIQAVEQGVISVPDPEHWRGWVHRDQAARSLWRAVRDNAEGIFNIASANLRFREAAGVVADRFGVCVEGDDKPDPFDYQVDAARARRCGLLDERAGEDLQSVARTFEVPRSGM